MYFNSWKTLAHDLAGGLAVPLDCYLSVIVADKVCIVS